MFKKFLGLLAAIAGLTASELSSGFGIGNNYATFPNGRYKYYGRTNGASRRRKSNRLRISKLTRNRHR